jgi:hypothetical protein
MSKYSDIWDKHGFQYTSSDKFDTVICAPKGWEFVSVGKHRYDVAGEYVWKNDDDRSMIHIFLSWDRYHPQQTLSARVKDVSESKDEWIIKKSELKSKKELLEEELHAAWNNLAATESSTTGHPNHDVYMIIAQEKYNKIQLELKNYS